MAEMAGCFLNFAKEKGGKLIFIVSCVSGTV